MTYNEEDIIDEVMQANKKFFDKIFVLDGSTDKTTEILRSYDNVKYLIQDKDLFPPRKIRDGARQFLLEKAQEMYGYEGWFTLLHGDEIFVDDPNEVIKRAEKVKAEIVNWHALNFFLHSSQKDTYDPKKPVQQQVIFYHPGGLEVRQFKNKKGIFYDLNQMYRVLPYGLKNRILFDYPIFKHYVVRSVKQKQSKPIGGIEARRDEISKNQNKPQSIKIDDIFVDKNDPERKQVRKYDGSFYEFEPGKRPPFFFQWLAWHKYRPIEWGIIGELFKKKS